MWFSYSFLHINNQWTINTPGDAYDVRIGFSSQMFYINKWYLDIMLDVKQNLYYYKQISILKIYCKNWINFEKI